MHPNAHRAVQAGLALAAASLLAACGGSEPEQAPQANGLEFVAAPSKKLLAAGDGVSLQTGQFVSLQVTTPGFQNRYLRHANGLAWTEAVAPSSSDVLKADATWRIAPALDGTPCYSLESKNFPGEYLRHSNYRVRRERSDGSELFRRDATFCAQQGFGSSGGIAFVSRNLPGYFLRHINAEVYVARAAAGRFSDGGASFNNDISWNLVGPWDTRAGGCNAQTWARGINYPLGSVVLYPANGQTYKLVNAGSNGSDGTDPTISTWYWQPASCDGGGGGGGFVVSEAQYNQMFPNRTPYYSYGGFVAALSAWPAFATAGSDTVRRQEAAAFLANMHHESGGGQYVRELNQANRNSYCSSGNCGGRQYYGRGPIQLSWDYNYRAAGSALGLDLLNNPDLVATDATTGWKTALWYWMTQRGGAARTPHDAMVASSGFGETIRAINGGIECNATGLGNQQMNARVELYRRFTALLGVAPGNNLGC